MQKRLICGSPVLRGWLFVIGWVFVFAASAGSLSAQLPVPNESGTSVGHVHMLVRNPEEHKKLWVDVLGAKVTHNGPLELLQLPGLFIILEKGEPTAGSGGSSLNHVGLWIKDYADVKAKLTASRVETASDNYKAQECAAGPGTPACQFTVVFPDGVRVEFTEDKKLGATASSHHIHMQTTDPESLRAWYAKTLGATAGLRRNTIMAAMFNSGEVDFNKADQAQAPTKGRAIDHFGIEVKGLEAFCKKLAAQGVTFETAYYTVPGTGVKSAFITDPVGARIELTEGLAAH